MLTGLNIGVFGGDERYIHIMQKACDEHANITAVGYETANLQDDRIHSTTLDKVAFSTLDVILLPVAGTDSHGKIHSSYTDETMTLTSELLKSTPSHCSIYTGTANNTLRQIADAVNRNLVIFFDRDDIAIANSIPTAEATLQIAMEKTKQTIHGANVLLTGYGRVGKTIAHLFHQIGANITVAARKEADIATIRSLTYNAVFIHEMRQNLQQADIIINTVPTMLFGQQELMIIDPDTLIIDVASKPGGVDFTLANDLHIEAIHALGLPGKVAPITAGEILADVLISFWKKT